MTNQHGGSFGNVSERLASLSARTLGWLPDEFWSSTPADLALALRGPNENPKDGLSRDELNSLLEGERNG